MSLTAVDCQSFAGGFTLGVARAGFDVVAKREGAAGFGVPFVLGNRGFFPHLDDVQASEPAAWRPVKRAALVFGNPPCSGFSGYTAVRNQTGSERGSDHSINQCMWDFVAYAASCDAKIAIMESVQAAGKLGRELMRELRFDMEERTGKRYDLIHVFHNNASVGGSSVRRRYFMVLARRGLKFGIESPSIDRVPVLEDLLKDLETQPLDPTWRKYARKKADPYVMAKLRAGEGLDGHDTIHNRENRHVTWVVENSPEWRGGEFLGSAMRRLIDAGIEPLETMRKADGSFLSSLLSTDPYRPRRAHARKPAPVITGTGVEDTIHPVLPRTLTFREAARIMGFPDDWSLAPILGEQGAKSSHIVQRQKWLGKGISVPCGEWIGGWAKRTLEGNPGAWRGEPTGEEAEWVIDVTNDYKKVYCDKTGEVADTRTKALKKEMEARAA